MPKTKHEHRPARAARRVREELTRLLGQELSDPRLAAVRVSQVEMTEDLSLARVFFVVGPGGDEAAAGAVLRRLQPMLRAKLAPRLDLRRVPELRFELDHNREETQRLERLLHEVGEDLRARTEVPAEPAAPTEPSEPSEPAPSSGDRREP
jgi:ribosome-binding factor A